MNHILFHKYEILKDFCKTPPKFTNFLILEHRKFIQDIRFQTIVADDFYIMENCFIKNNNDNSWKKQIPQKYW